MVSSSAEMTGLTGARPTGHRAASIQTEVLLETAGPVKAAPRLGPESRRLTELCEAQSAGGESTHVGKTSYKKYSGPVIWTKLRQVIVWLSLHEKLHRTLKVSYPHPPMCAPHSCQTSAVSI